MSSSDLRFISRLDCKQRSCPHAGKLLHRAHGACRMATCLDQGTNHWGDHRVKVVAPPEEPE